MLRWMDGFEHYGTIDHMVEGVGGGAAWSDVSGWTLSTANPATGAYHMRMTDSLSNRTLRRVFGQAKQVTGVGYRFSISDLPDSEGEVNGAAIVLADVRDAANDSHITILLGTDGSIVAQRGFEYDNSHPAGTIIGRSDPCVAPGGYHHFELKSKIDNSTGYIEVRINQVTVLNLTGIDTQNTTNATAGQIVIGLGGGTVGAGFTSFDLDDAFAWDDDASDADNTIVDFIGDKGCYWLAPNADTVTSDWTVNGSATAYGAIDEVPPSGTDYLDTAATTARTIVGVATLPGTVAEVIAFQPVIYAKKDESGSVTLRTGVVSGSDESYGPDDDPSTAYGYMQPGPKTIDPATGVAWANTAAPKLLIERTA